MQPVGEANAEQPHYSPKWGQLIIDHFVKIDEERRRKLKEFLEAPSDWMTVTELTRSIMKRYQIPREEYKYYYDKIKVIIDRYIRRKQTKFAGVRVRKGESQQKKLASPEIEEKIEKELKLAA